MQRKKQKNGFTLIELIVAVGIILILASVATALILKQIDRAQVAKIIENYNQIKSAANSCIVKNKGVLHDYDNDGDYLDDMIKDGCILPNYNHPECAKWTIIKYVDPQTSDVLWFVNIDPSNCPDRILSFFNEMQNILINGFNP